MAEHPKNRRTSHDMLRCIQIDGVDAFIQNSTLAGGSIWSKIDITVAMHLCQDIVMHPFFQDKTNLHALYATDDDKRQFDNETVQRGNFNHNIANTLMRFPSFRTSAMGLDLDFLCTSFDGVNTPGLFGLVLGGEPWLQTLMKKHQRSLAELISQMYDTHDDYMQMFKLSKPMQNFILGIESQYQQNTGKTFELMTSPSGNEPFSPEHCADFAVHQIEVLSLQHIQHAMAEELENYYVGFPKPDIELFVNSIEALNAFYPDHAMRISNTLHDKSKRLLLPTAANEFVTMLANRIEIESLDLMFEPNDVEPQSAQAQMY